MRFVPNPRLWLFFWLAAALLAGGPRSALADHDGRWLRALRALDSEKSGGRIVIVRGDDDPIVIRDRIVDRGDRIVIRDRNVRRHRDRNAHRHRDRHRVVIAEPTGRLVVPGRDRVVIAEPTGRLLVLRGDRDLGDRVRVKVDRILSERLGQARGKAWRAHDRAMRRVHERLRDDRVHRRDAARERSQRRGEIRREMQELRQEIQELEEELEEELDESR